METKQCWICTKIFPKPITCSKKDWLKRKFCSISCTNKSFVGKPNKSSGSFKKGHTPWIKGKKRTDIQGSKHHQWKGGRIKRKGYVFIHKPEHPYCDSLGYVREHRLIMEQKLGRILDPKEVVHHINEIKGDNRVENLMLFKDNKEHLAHHHSLNQ